MEKILAILVLLCSIKVVNAQNPFEQFGHKGKVLTATNGRFNEFHDLDSVVQIGSVLLDVHKLVIVGNAPIDTVTYMPSPTTISRWLSPDPLGEKYYQLSPYNFVANNPILYTDPDGREIQVHFENEEAKKLYLNMVNKAFNNQFKVSLTAVKGKDGVFKVGVEKAKDGGDLSKLGKGAQSFYKEFTKIVNSDVVVSMDIVHNESDVNVGNFQKQSMDMADVAQFPEFDPTKDSQDGPTQAGKIIHETAEQFNKANKEGVYTAHDRAISYENATNGNERSRQDKYLGSGAGVVQTFHLKNGSSVSFQIIGGQNSAKRGTIIVRPYTPAKK
jgi:hypothetical protein